MMKDCKFDNSGFEKVLKDKMDEMASSVDCFDKISKRTFPENSGESSKHQFIISDLENVTGKKKHFRFMPIAALAAAAVLCVFILPKSEGFMNFVSSNIGGSDKKVFRELVNEIKTETDSYTYKHFDFTLDEYIKNDVMITPIYRCPFEAKEREDIKVRIFVKMAGDIPTNQVYAVEYEGKYEDGNYIAAADSKAKFTNENYHDLSDLPDIQNFVSDESKFDVTESSFVDSEGIPITVAAFNYNCIYKNGSDIYSLANEIMYYHRTDDEDNSEYYYDINSIYSTDSDSSVNGTFDDALFDGCWNNVVYYNGKSAKADKNSSNFTKTDIFSNINSTVSGEEASTYFMPFGYAENEDDKYDLRKEIVHLTFAGKEAGNIMSPLLPELCHDFKVYIPNDNGKFEIYSDTIDTISTAKYTSSSSYFSVTGTSDVRYDVEMASEENFEVQNQESAEREEQIRSEAEEKRKEMEMASEENFKVQNQESAEREEQIRIEAEEKRKEAELLQKEMKSIQQESGSLSVPHK